MGLLSGLLGHSSKADVSKLGKEYAPLLADGEELVAAYRVLRDMMVFTTKRLILVNKQGVTGSKVEYLTIPYERIIRFSKESAGILDLEAELKIWVSGQAVPLQHSLGRNSGAQDIVALLAQHAPR